MMASPTYTHITTYQFDYFLLISILCELCLIVLLLQTPACLMDHHLPIIVSFVVDLGASAAKQLDAMIADGSFMALLKRKPSSKKKAININ